MNTNRWLIHRHLAEHMDSRLLLLRQTPKHILLHGADANISRSLLMARYPNATFTEFEPRQDFIDETLSIRKTNWLNKWLHKTPTFGCLKPQELLPTESADMLWSNLLLQRETHTAQLLQNWAQALQPNGLLFFTCLGEESFLELRAVFQAASIDVHTENLPEMHDLGDLLLEHGFYDPIMDTAKLVLSYENLPTLLQDLDTIGAWQALSPKGILPEHCLQQAITAAWQCGALREITLETVFGHALKKTILPDNAQPIQFYPRTK